MVGPLSMPPYGCKIQRMGRLVGRPVYGYSVLDTGYAMNGSCLTLRPTL